MITEFTMPIRTDGGDLAYTFTKEVEMPLIPERTMIAINGFEFPARCYLDADDWKYNVLLAQDFKFSADQIPYMVKYLRAKGWTCAYEKEAKK